MRTINRERVLAEAGHVVLLMGGTSPEREISLLSGQAVASSLSSLGVHTTIIDVGENIVDELRSAAPDLVVNMLHGQGGEDGVIQGYMDLLQIPYTGSGVLASALAMDKVKSKQIWCQMGLATASFTVLNDESDWGAIIASFERAVVKPIYGGSSLGIAVVDSPESLKRAYTEACGFQQGVMAEKYIEGPEYSTGILDDELMPTILLETDREFFDFTAKYIDEGTRIVCPAPLSRERMDAAEALVKSAYSALGCSGLARVDFMADAAGEFFLLEVNTVPGMTSHSFVPKSAARVGIDFDELVLRILDGKLNG
ncbi:MAG: D-alanine--D-alanine ligase [Pseudomonadota bacterium]|nr:D-alanine--D-alanine ligase [Pseudomonadota bacterium]MEC9086524.1 D-alanine--D-alanine ligase [Pseudomonadota bacterium]MED5310903.1 D-alanine--D-alanine ligase [Pseudomonadota bacterium]MEE3010778.1 D-alanine--D-alanine ligase [Pseudomonadota bacterium]